MIKNIKLNLQIFNKKIIMDSTSKQTYLLTVKRGMRWSERRVELTNDTISYYNPSKFFIFLSYLFFRGQRIKI